MTGMTFQNVNTVLVLNSDPISDKNMLENRKTVEIKRIDMCKERYKEGGNNWFFYFFFFFLGLDYLQFFADFQKSFQITFNCMSILSNFLSGVTAAVKRRNFEIDIYVIET